MPALAESAVTDLSHRKPRSEVARPSRRSVRVRRDISGVGKIIDVRRFVSISVWATMPSQRAFASRSRRPCRVSTHVATADWSAKAAEVVEAPRATLSVERRACGADGRRRFALDLDAHRKKPTATAGDAVLPFCAGGVDAKVSRDLEGSVGSLCGHLDCGPALTTPIPLQNLPPSRLC